MVDRSLPHSRKLEFLWKIPRVVLVKGKNCCSNCFFTSRICVTHVPASWTNLVDYTFPSVLSNRPSNNLQFLKFIFMKFKKCFRKIVSTIIFIDGFFLFLPNTCLRCNFLQSKENLFPGLHFETTKITSNWPEKTFFWPTAKPSSNYRSSSILNHFSSIHSPLR